MRCVRRKMRCFAAVPQMQKEVFCSHSFSRGKTVFGVRQDPCFRTRHVHAVQEQKASAAYGYRFSSVFVSSLEYSAAVPMENRRRTRAVAFFCLKNGRSNCSPGSRCYCCSCSSASRKKK